MTICLEESSITKKVCEMFTIDYQKEYTFDEHKLDIDFEFNIGFITGQSGSGKSLLLKTFGKEKEIKWYENEAVCSHFKNYTDAIDRLQAVGFNSVPQWLLPRRVLSQGQGYRVDLARSLQSNMVRDEFTSTIDRNTAMGLCNSVQRYIRDKNLTNVIFAGVHQDVIPFLKPDWIYNTDERTLTINKDKYDMTVKDNKPYFMKIEG
jgi:ABC-type ATPase with predicted acetyltransferase domain